VAGVPAIQLSIAGLLPQSLAQAGHSFRGVVAELEGALVIRTNAAPIPIGNNAGLDPGQHVSVRVLTAGANPQVQISPLSVVVNVDAASSALLHAAGPKFAGDIVAQGGKLLFVHGKISLHLPKNQTLFAAGDRAVFQSQSSTNGIRATLAPAVASATITTATSGPQSPQIPVPLPIVGTAAAAQIQTLFTQAGSLGAGFAALNTSIAAPVVAAAIPADIGTALAAVLAPLLRPDAADFSAGVKRWSRRLATPPEAALATAGGKASDTPATVMQLLRSDPALRQVLAERGELRAFDAMADRILDRLGGGSLQQLRSLEQPYWFSEFPFDPASGIERALVHFFTDQSGSGVNGESPSASVVLDLSLTRMGDVWAKLVLLAGQCTCHISVTSEDVLGLVQQYTDELTTGLASTGPEHVSVHADLWDGNRIDRSAALLSAMDGMDLSA
jgi:hypothetical protein